MSKRKNTVQSRMSQAVADNSSHRAFCKLTVNHPLLPANKWRWLTWGQLSQVLKDLGCEDTYHHRLCLAKYAQTDFNSCKGTLMAVTFRNDRKWNSNLGRRLEAKYLQQLISKFQKEDSQ